MYPILAVDTNIAVHEAQTAEWAKYDIRTLRVDTMHEAIARLIRKEKFLFVAINEDSNPNFMQQLPVMRDVTGTSIFVITSNYTIDKKIRAMELGADVYDPFTAYAKQNVIAALEILKLQNRWAGRPKKPLPVLICGDILMTPAMSQRNVFVKDTRVPLPKLEFDILHCLMEHSGHVMTHSQLLHKVWGEEYAEVSHDVLRNAIKRLREKLRVSPDSPNYIETEREVGYILLDRKNK